MTTNVNGAACYTLTDIEAELARIQGLDPAYFRDTPGGKNAAVAECETALSAAAAILGRRGGAKATEAQKAAARANGCKGGRPRGTYVYRVTDGTRRQPRGHVGYADTREEALALRTAKCRMGGYITRERVTPVAK